jgi:hypothetical protein
MQSTNHILLYGNDLGPNYSSTATQTILSQLSVLYIGLTSMHDSFGPHTTAPPLKLDSLTFSGPALHMDDTSLFPLNILRRRGSQYVLTPGLNISAFADAAVPVARASGPEVASSLLPFERTHTCRETTPRNLLVLMGVLALAASYPWHACGGTCNGRVYVWSMMATAAAMIPERNIRAGAPAARA